MTRLHSLLFALLMLPLALQAQSSGDAHYIELKPSFVGTVGPGPRIQYLKVDVALRAEDAAAVARIQHHDPLIRNALVGLFAKQTPESLAGLDGKEQLRADALARVREVLEEEEGQPLVADLLFTNLITQ